PASAGIFSPVITLAFSPDGKRLARSTGHIMHSPPTDRTLVRSLWLPGRERGRGDLGSEVTNEGPSRDNLLTFNPTGAWGVAAQERSADSVCIVDPNRPQPRSHSVGIRSDRNDRFEGPAFSIEGGPILALAAGNSHLAIAGRDGFVTFGAVDPDTRLFSNPTRLRGHVSEIRSLAISPDDNHVAAVSNSEVTLWDVRQKQGREAFLSAMLRLHRPGALDNNSPQSSPDGRWLYSTERQHNLNTMNGPPESRIDIFDTANPDQGPRHLKTHLVSASMLAVSPDGSLCAIPGEDREANQAVKRYMAGDRNRAPSLAEITRRTEQDVGISLVEISTGQVRRELKGHKGPITTLRFNRDGTRLISGSLDHTWRIWDVSTGGELRRQSGQARAVRAGFSPDGQWIVSGDGQRKIRVWSQASEQPLRTFDCDRGENAKDTLPRPVVWAIHTSPSKALLAFPEAGGNVQVWDLTHDISRYLCINFGRSIEAIAFFGDGTRLLTAGDGVLRFWYLETGKEIFSIPADRDLYGRLPEIAALVDRLEREMETSGQKDRSLTGQDSL
ncbi:WD40 repeat domain-containing protein, partial [Singulisphaera rosea]